MTIKITHSDMSGLEWYEPNGIWSIADAQHYMDYVNRVYPGAPYRITIEGITVEERKDHNKPSIIYL